MNRIEELENQLAQLGAPKADWSDGARGLAVSWAAKKAWRAANPEASARYDMLAAQIDAELAAVEAKEAAARHAAALERLVRGSGLGSRDVDAARMPSKGPAWLAARDWRSDPSHPTWLCLLGPRGTGKTVAAASCVLEVLEAGGTAQYRRMAEVSRLSSFDEGREDLERMKRLDLLVLDDVGTEHFTAHAGGLLFDLLDTRHANRRRTIVCSNLEGKQLAERLGERLADRIQADGRVVALKGASLRGVTGVAS